MASRLESDEGDDRVVNNDLNLVFINSSQETFTPTQSGAIATVIWELCQAARRVGIEPTVITRHSPAPPYPLPGLVQVKHPTEPRSKAGIYLWRGERRLTGWRHLRQRQYAMRVVKAIKRLDLSKPVFVLNNDPEMAVLFRKKFPASRIIHCFHNQHECKPRFRRQLAASIDMATAVSGFTANWIASYYAIPAERVRSNHNGVDLKHFSPSTICPAAHPVVNFLGRTGIEKGLDILLDAALLVSRNTREFSLQLLGSNHWDRFVLDDYQRLLNDRVDQLQSRGIEVRRPGHVGRYNLPAELRKAHINVVPARWDEPFGLTTLEGMACGLATVAARTGGTPEVVGDAGIFFERESVNGLAEILERLIRDDAMRREYGGRARARAEQFSWDRSWAALWSCCR